MKNTDLKKSINKLIDFLILNAKNEVTDNDLEKKTIKTLISNGVLSSDGSVSKVAKDPNKTFDDELAKRFEVITGKSIPINPLEILDFLFDLREKLLKNRKSNILNEYSFLIDQFRSRWFISLHNSGKVNLTKHLLETVKVKNGKFLEFQNLYFDLLPHLNLSKEELAEIYNEFHKIDRLSYSLNKFTSEVSTVNKDRALQLLSTLKAIKGGTNYLGVLLVGLYNSGHTEAQEEALKLAEDDISQSIYFLTYKNYKNIEEIKKAIVVVENIKTDNIAVISRKIEFFISLLSQSRSNATIRTTCFAELMKHYIEGTDKIEYQIINGLGIRIKGLEKERTNFLNEISAIKLNPNFLNHFFHNYESPIYLFDFLESWLVSKKSWQSLEPFEADIMHFWNSNQEEALSLILQLLAHEKILIRYSAIHIILSGIQMGKTIDILKLTNKTDQLKSIEAFGRFPHSIEKITPIFLMLRKSKHKEVVKYLQGALSVLIFEAYHSFLYNIIVDSLGDGVKDKKFLEPLTAILKEYEKISEIKSSINEINPFKNERDWLNLYGKWAHENQANVMKDVQETRSGIRELFGKPITIVRGNGFKMDGEETVSQMGVTEYSAAIDIRAYKNPELFEINLSSNKSKY